MIQDQKSKTQLDGFGNKFVIILNKYEWILLVIVLIGYYLQYKHIKYGRITLVFSLSSLSMLYFYSSFASIKHNASIALEKLIHKVLYYCWASGSAAILFFILKWPHVKVILIVSLILNMIGLTTMLIYKQNNPKAEFYNKQYNMRNGTFLVITLLLLASYFN